MIFCTQIILFVIHFTTMNKSSESIILPRSVSVQNVIFNNCVISNILEEVVITIIWLHIYVFVSFLLVSLTLANIILSI